MKNGVEGQLQLATLGTQNQMVALSRLAERCRDNTMDHQNNDYQSDTERNREPRQQRRELSLLDASPGNLPETHNLTISSKNRLLQLVLYQPLRA